MSMKKALVTGAKGFVGRHMTRHLESRGWSVEGWDLPDRDMSICLPPLMVHTFDLVVHLAYHVGGRKGIESGKNLCKNLILDSTLFEWAERTSPKPRILYFSSSAAYPVHLQEKGNYCYLAEENMVGYPDADYGFAKSVGEKLAGNYAAGGGRVHVVRPFSGYGEDQSLDYPFPSFVERAKQKKNPFPIWGDPTSIRDWIHIEDVVKGAMAVVERDCRIPINLCTGRATRMEELARMCMLESGYLADIETIEGPMGVHSRAGDPRRLLSIYTPMITLEEGIRRAFQ